MPSKDDYHEKHPEKTTWLREEESGSSQEVSVQGKRRATARRVMSAQVQRLARRLGSDADELAGKIPADTLRRTKYPVREEVTADGKRIFKDDLQVVEGPRPLIRQ